MTERFVVERAVELRNGARAVLSEFVVETEAEARGLVERMTAEEAAMASARMVLPQANGLVDSGYTLAEYLTEVVGVHDVGFRIVRVPGPPSIIV